MAESDDGWVTGVLGDMRLFQAGNLTRFPELVHGFTGRTGGVSREPYSSLNLGGHVGDSWADVDMNRTILASALGFNGSDIALAEQVHGCEIAVVSKPGGRADGADALVTDTPRILLMLMYADCVPVFLYDRVNSVIAVIHSGWKGTSKNIVEKTVSVMKQEFGSDPAQCAAAIGPCIGFDNYEVGKALGIYFENLPFVQQSDERTGFLTYNEPSGRYHLNLRQMVKVQLVEAGVSVSSIAVSSLCTFNCPDKFFSHRRDAAMGTQTGRMAAVMGLAGPSGSKRNS